MLLDLDVQIHNAKALVIDSFDMVDQTILNCVYSNNNSNLISAINTYIGSNSGKKLRPLLLLLSAYATDNLETNHNNYINLAAATELIHVASLLHDDVLDGSLKRRNTETINADFDNKYAILAGDFLFGKAFKLITTIDSSYNNHISSLVASTTNLMVEGEMLQLLEKYNFNIHQNKYLQIITAKTAELFLMSMRLPTILNCNNVAEKILAECGMNLGIAYQLLNDIFDYYQYGHDTIDGVITLPVIFCLNCTNTSINTKKKIINIIKKQASLDDCQQLTQLNLLKNILLNNGGFDYTINLAKQYLTKSKIAIKGLSTSKYQQAILQIIDCLLEFQLPDTVY